MGDAAEAFEPVGQYYNAFSSDEASTTTELTDSQFRQLFNFEEVSALNDLLGESIVAPDHPAPDGWTQRVKEALLDTGQAHMNALLQDALKQVCGVEGLFTVDEENHLIQVNEQDMCNLFIDGYNDECGLKQTKGLPVTLQSQPNFAVWTRGGGGMLITGVGKNETKYVLDNAIRQSAAYMLVHLFYWLVAKSKAVESVYGIAVAGVNCKDMVRDSKFAVALMRLSLPAVIGGQLRIKMYLIHRCDSLEQLWTFVTFLCRKTPAKSLKLQVGCGRPACLQMPLELLKTKPNGWTMVKNGTANLVVRIDRDQGWTALGKFLEVHARKRLNEDLNKGGKERCYPIYFKSKNFLATSHPQHETFYMFARRAKSDSLLDIQDVYLAPPRPTASGLYILMSHVGHPFRTAFYGSLQDFASAFLRFMSRVLACQEYSRIVHGDIHFGNLLVDDDQRLRLIDYDEARYDGLDVRKPQTEHQKFVYNQRLVEDLVEFTKSQLMQLCWDCWIIVRTVSGGSSLANIRVTQVIGGYHAYFAGGQSPDAKAVNDVYETLHTVLAEISCGRLSTNSTTTEAS